MTLPVKTRSHDLILMKQALKFDFNNYNYFLDDLTQSIKDIHIIFSKKVLYIMKNDFMQEKVNYKKTT